MNAHSYCHYCGVKHVSDAWPRQCGACSEITWRNPLPVSNLLVKADGGLLVVRRNIEPGFGKWALPGGYIDHGETWQQGASRELREEAGVHWPSDQIRLVDVRSSSNGNLLIFGVTTKDVLVPVFEPNSEVSEIQVIREPLELAFPTHTEMVNWFFHNRKNHWIV